MNPQVRGRRREHLGLPPLPLRGVLVHLVEGARPQRRLVAPAPPADLDDDVLAVVRILGHEQRLQARAELGGARLGGLGLLAQVCRHLGVGLVLGEGARLLRLVQRGAARNGATISPSSDRSLPSRRSRSGSARRPATPSRPGVARSAPRSRRVGPKGPCPDYPGMERRLRRRDCFEPSGVGVSSSPSASPQSRSRAGSPGDRASPRRSVPQLLVGGVEDVRLVVIVVALGLADGDRRLRRPMRSTRRSAPRPGRRARPTHRARPASPSRPARRPRSRSSHRALPTRRAGP